MLYDRMSPCLVVKFKQLYDSFAESGYRVRLLLGRNLDAVSSSQEHKNLSQSKKRLEKESVKNKFVLDCTHVSYVMDPRKLMSRMPQSNPLPLAATELHHEADTDSVVAGTIRRHSQCQRNGPGKGNSGCSSIATEE